MKVRIFYEQITAQPDIQRWERSFCCGHCSSINCGDTERWRHKICIRLLSPSGRSNFHVFFLQHLWHLASHLKSPWDIRCWSKPLLYHLFFHICMYVCIFFLFETRTCESVKVTLICSENSWFPTSWPVTWALSQLFHQQLHWYFSAWNGKSQKQSLNLLTLERNASPSPSQKGWVRCAAIKGTWK